MALPGKIPHVFFWFFPCLNWPSLAKKKQKITRRICHTHCKNPMVELFFAWRKCWNMEDLLPSARTTALRPQKTVSVYPLDFIPYDHNPLRRYHWIHFAKNAPRKCYISSRRFCMPQPRQVLKSSGWKVRFKRVYWEDPGRTAPQIVIGELFFCL